MEKKRPRRIWLVTVGEPLPLKGEEFNRPWRTSLLARTLCKQGHKVLWWTSTLNHFTKTFFQESDGYVQIDENLSLFFLHGCHYKKNISLRRFINHVLIARKFSKYSVTEEKPDLIIASLPTLELSRAVVKFGKHQNIPTIIDIRDLWPDEIIKRVPKMMKKIACFFFWPMFRDLKFALKNCTYITAISKTYLQWGLKWGERLPSKFDRVFPMGYPSLKETPDLSPPASLSRFADLAHKNIIWFIGSFIHSFDLKTVIDAAQILLERKQDQFIFVLSGAGENFKIIKEYGSSVTNVIFTGWLSQQEIYQLGKLAWVGIAPYKRDALMSLPNKIFEYMSFGLPILISLEGEAQAFVENFQMGIAYPAGDAHKLAECIVELNNSSPLYLEMRANSQTSFNKYFFTDKTYKDFVDYIEHIL